MDIRNGKCFDCGAEYQIPASFPHDVARCKECGKAVHIAAVGEPMPTPPAKASAAPPAPAKRVSAKSSGGLEEYKPSGKKGAGPSMMERLRAERAAAAGAGAAAAGAAPKPKSASKGAPAKSSARRGAAGAKAGAKAGARGEARGEARGGARTKGGSSRSGKGRRGRSETTERGRRGGRDEQEKKSPALLIGAVVLLAGGGAAFAFKDELFGGADPTNAQEPTEDVATADDGTATPDPVDTDGAEAAAVEDSAPADADPAGDTPEDGADDAGGDDAEAAGGDADASAEPEVVDLGPDTTQLPEIGPILGTSDDQMAEMADLIETWMDPYAGAAGARAGNKLKKEFGVRAMPAMVNSLRMQDLSTKEGYDVAYQVKEALKELVYGRNFGWKSINEPDYEPKGLAFNRKVVAAWHTQIQKLADEGIEYYISFAKLEEKVSRDSDEYKFPDRAKLAAQLRTEYGDGTAPAPDAAGGSDDEDDLEID